MFLPWTGLFVKRWKGRNRGGWEGGREEGESRGGEKVRKVLKYACPGRRLLGCVAYFEA